MIRRLTAVAAGVGVMLVGSLASAQVQTQSHGYFGDQGEFMFSAGRLVPIFGFASETQNTAGPLPAGVTKQSATESSSQIGFLWGGTPGYAVSATATLPNVFTVPRLGFDYTIVPNVTVGGDLVVFFTLGGSQSTETDNNGGGKTTTSVSEPKSTIFGIAPRAGYIIHVNDLLSVWLRGGLSYYTASVRQTATDMNNVKTTEGTNVDQFALDLEPQLVITPTSHFGFTLGVNGDIPLTGGHTDFVNTPTNSTSNSAWSSLVYVGVTGGLIGWF
jgi:hypothetical protein